MLLINHLHNALPTTNVKVRVGSTFLNINGVPILGFPIAIKIHLHWKPYPILQQQLQVRVRGNENLDFTTKTKEN